MVHLCNGIDSLQTVIDKMGINLCMEETVLEIHCLHFCAVFLCLCLHQLFDQLLILQGHFIKTSGYFSNVIIHIDRCLDADLTFCRILDGI